jgi:predicted HTH domain antitoxin
MPSKTISTRLDPDEVDELESLVEQSGTDRATLVKLLLRRGMKSLRMESAVQAFRNEEVTLSRAAAMAGVGPWDFIARMRSEGLELHYGVADFDADLEALARPQ